MMLRNEKMAQTIYSTFGSVFMPVHFLSLDLVTLNYVNIPI